MARRQVSIFINGREVANQIKAITAEKRKIVNELNRMTIGTKEYNAKVKELDKANNILGAHKQKISGIESTWTKLSTGIKQYATVAGAALIAKEVISYGAELGKLGTEMEVLGKKAQTVLGEALPLVSAQAEKNAHAMGLTTGAYIDQATAIADLLIPMKFQREEAANISSELVNLSGALSEWTGGQKTAEEVSKVLGKAILGEREGLKELGISISEADVSAELAKKGLKNLTGEMLQQAKAAVTLELITQKSADAQAAYADNSTTLVRKQAELSAKFAEVKEALANALIPVFHRLFEIATPIVDTFSDIVIAIAQGDKAVGKLGGGMQILATILGNAGKIVLFVHEGFQRLGSFLLNNFGGTIDFVGTAAIGLNNAMVQTINKIGELTGIKTRLQPLDAADFRKSIEDAKAALNELPTNTPAKNAIAAPKNNSKAILQQQAQANEQKKIAEKATADRIQIAEKEAEELAKREQRLQETIAKIQADSNIDRLSEEDQKLAQLAEKYNEQIAKAIELEAKGSKEATAQRLTLERLKDAALTELQNELFDASIQKLAEQEEARTEAELENIRSREEAKQEALAQIREQIEEVFLSEREQQLLDLEAQFEETLAIAEAHEIDTLDIKLAFQKKKRDLVSQFDEEDKAQLLKSQQEQAKILAEGFAAASNVIGSAMSALGDIAKENTLLGKGLALTQIGISAAEAIAKGTAASAGVPFPGNLIAIATTVASVLAQIGAARKILKQKKEGGWHNVRGEDDGKTYRAKYIGRRPSGMLPEHPVVLASERGKEYFVSNKDLSNPYIINHVRAIENIIHHRLPQFVEGGFSEGTPPNASATATLAAPNPTQEILIQVLIRLDRKLDNIYARIDDNTVLDIQNRFGDLQNASGGVL